MKDGRAIERTQHTQNHSASIVKQSSKRENFTRKLHLQFPIWYLFSRCFASCCLLRRRFDWVILVWKIKILSGRLTCSPPCVERVHGSFSQSVCRLVTVVVVIVVVVVYASTVNWVMNGPTDAFLSGRQIMMQRSNRERCGSEKRAKQTMKIERNECTQNGNCFLNDQLNWCVCVCVRMGPFVCTHKTQAWLSWMSAHSFKTKNGTQQTLFRNYTEIYCRTFFDV